MNCIFLTGFFSNSRREEILQNSKGMIQFSADVVQRKFILGFIDILKNKFNIVNLPFISSYPKFYKSIYFRGSSDVFGKFTVVKNVGFVNLWGVKFFSRIFSSLINLIIEVRRPNSILIVYSTHTPFLVVARFLKRINPNLKICLIILDLPIFTVQNAASISGKIRIFEARFISNLIKGFDCYSVVTKSMIDALHLQPDRCVLIEGMAVDSVELLSSQDEFNECPDSRVFFYSGYISERYGILDLLKAFMLIDDPSLQLWICGDGDGRSKVLQMSNADSRIKYFGQVDNDQVLYLQRRATILVNPRTPELDFTKFSFPSKILEYMSSGRPVIMYKLDGIPDEYSPYFFSPAKVDVSSLSLCMRNVINLDLSYLHDFGLNAKKFVLMHKNPSVQVSKLINLISSF